MQNRQCSNYKIEYQHFQLPLDFPVFNLTNEKYVLSDKDVTRLHYHNCLEIGYCCKGAGIYIVDDKIMPFTQGDVSVIFKNQIHIGQSQRENLSQWQFILLDPEQFLTEAKIYDISLISDIVNGRQSFINIISHDKHPEITRLVQLIILELENRENLYQLAIRGLVLTLVANLDRLIKLTPNNDIILSSDSLMRVSTALNYISKNYMNEIRIATLAKLCNCSVTNFRRLFHLALNISPSDYISKIRIQMSTIFLKNTDYTVLRIAESVGYVTLSCFNRQFKKTLGVSPKTWRKKNAIS